MAEKEITIELKHLEAIALIGFLSAAFFLELQLSMNSPIAFGDEGFHTRMAQWIAQEKEIPVWFPFQGDNTHREGFSRPPLWNILEASFFYIFGFNDVIVKILTPFIGSTVLGLTVFTVVRRLYKEEVAFIASILVVAMPSIVTYSVLFYVDILFTLYFFLSVSCLIFAIQTEKKKYWILAGVFAALALLTKKPGYFLFPIFGLAFLYEFWKQKDLLKLMKKYLISIMFFALISSTFFIRNQVYYKTPTCELLLFGFKNNCVIDTARKPIYEFEGKTEQEGTEANVYTIGLTNYLNFAYGFTYGNIYLLIFGFLGGLFILLTKRNLVNLIMIFSMISFLLLFYYVTGRAEDTSRYTLAWAPFIALIAGVYFSEIYDFVKKYLKQFAIVVFVLILVLSFVEVQTKLVGLKPVKAFSNYFFEACDWVKQNPDKVPENSLISTVWVARTAYNCQRNVGGGSADVTLSGNVSLALSVLKEQGVTHLFIQKFSISNQNLSEKYPWQYIQMLENNPKVFEKIYENGESDLNKCLTTGCDGTIIYRINYSA